MTLSTHQQGGAPDAGRKILVIDDDRELCSLIRDYLTPLGYQVTAVHDGKAGAERAVDEKFHAIILDVMLPGIDGFEVLKRIRDNTESPIIMLTSRGDETDRIVGLELGADDYLPKTFSSRELLARLRAVTRRATRPAANAGKEEAEIVVGPLRIDPSRHIALLEETALKLTALEFDLLLALAGRAGA